MGIFNVFVIAFLMAVDLYLLFKIKDLNSQLEASVNMASDWAWVASSRQDDIDDLTDSNDNLLLIIDDKLDIIAELERELKYLQKNGDGRDED